MCLLNTSLYSQEKHVGDGLIEYHHFVFWVMTRLKRILSWDLAVKQSCSQNVKDENCFNLVKSLRKLMLGTDYHSSDCIKSTEVSQKKNEIRNRWECNTRHSSAQIIYHPFLFTLKSK